MKNTVGKLREKGAAGSGNLSSLSGMLHRAGEHGRHRQHRGRCNCDFHRRPGAIFWMWLMALLGMISKTAEVTLAVHYREKDDNGVFHGGPMYYMRKGLGWAPSPRCSASV